MTNCFKAIIILGKNFFHLRSGPLIHTTFLILIALHSRWGWDEYSTTLSLSRVFLVVTLSSLSMHNLDFFLRLLPIRWHHFNHGIHRPCLTSSSSWRRRHVRLFHVRRARVVPRESRASSMTGPPGPGSRCVNPCAIMWQKSVTVGGRGPVIARVLNMCIYVKCLLCGFQHGIGGAESMEGRVKLFGFGGSPLWSTASRTSLGGRVHRCAVPAEHIHERASG